MMDFNDLKQAAQILDRINSFRNYVTKERFAMVAQTRFSITNERIWEEKRQLTLDF